MPEQTGVQRPGGRTAHTRAAVHAAVRALLAEQGGCGEPLSMAAVAARAGVHPTTLYRRWRTTQSLLLDLAVERVTQESPVPATGDLRADLTVYVDQLLTGLQRAGSASLLQTMIAAAAQQDADAEVKTLLQPRVAQFQAMLDACEVTAIDALRLVELVLAPAYFWAQLAAPLDPHDHTARLVDTVMVLVDADGR